MTHLLTIMFRVHAGQPEGPAVALGTLVLNGDSYVDFHYSIDIEAEAWPFDAFTRGLLRQVPGNLRAAVNIWPAYRKRAVPHALRETDPLCLIAYLERAFRDSSYFVGEVEDVGGSTPAERRN